MRLVFGFGRKLCYICVCVCIRMEGCFFVLALIPPAAYGTEVVPSHDARNVNDTCKRKEYYIQKKNESGYLHKLYEKSPFCFSSNAFIVQYRFGIHTRPSRDLTH